MIVRSVADVAIRFAFPGEHVALDHPVPDGRLGLVLTAPNLELCIVGTPWELRQQFFEALAMPVPADLDLGLDEPHVVLIEQPPTEEPG